MLEITSKDNGRLKTARAARDGRTRDALFIEGLRLAEEAASADLQINDYFFTDEFAANPRGAALLEKLRETNGARVSAKLLESIAETKTPQGIVVLAARPETKKFVSEAEKSGKGETAEKAKAQFDSKNSHALSSLRLFSFSYSPPLFVVLHELNNPANIGAILRTAEAAGASGVILTENSADAFAPKSLRAAMGSAFRLPLWTNAKFVEAIEFCRANQIKTVCAELSAGKTHTEIDWTLPRALIIGSEARGLSAEEIAQANEGLRIPMRAPVESLNAAVACGVILYEAARQRRLTNNS